jgi:endoglucanase
MIDIHNFARLDGAIIGQGGPTDKQFASLWAELATKYATEEKIVFELMNEPHDLDVAVWARTCQSAVTAIRLAGAKTQMILLPGSNFDSAATLASSKGGAEELLAVTNPDGGTDGLLLDIHKYLDEDNSGTHAECVTDNVDAFASVANFLRQNGRQGIVSETGASSDASCMKAFCSQNAFINANSDVLIGLVGWGAGSFDSSYLLSLTPSKQGNQYVDNDLAAQCVIKTWLDSNETVPSFTATKTSSATKTMTMSGAPTDSSVMTVTMTGTAISDEPTTLLVASGAPSPFRSSTNSVGETSSAPVLTSSTGSTASPTGSALGNRAERLRFPGTLLALAFMAVMMLN